MKLQKIGFVVSSLSATGGGIFSSAWEQVRLLGEDGWSVSVFGPKDDYHFRDRNSWGSSNVHALKCYGPQKFSFVPGLRIELFNSELYLVHQHGLWGYPSIEVKNWSARTERPVVISPHGMLDSWALNNSWLKKKLALRLFEENNLQSADCLHALNSSELNAIRCLGLANPVAVIPNAMRLPASKVTGNSISNRADNARLKRTVLFLGRVHPKKGLREAVEAWHDLKNYSPEIISEWQLRIVGWDDGGFLTELKRLVSSLGLANDVIFGGPVFGGAKD